MDSVIPVLSLLSLINLQCTEACLCSLLIADGKFTCPPPPSCCESGQYAYDECGCCLKCAKAELQTCGGAEDISGKCAEGLQCLKSCRSCKTVGSRGQPCIFPFLYSGERYESCTTRDSDTGLPWCATRVDSEGWVVDHAWGDCGEGCPGTQFECDDKYFSIQEGKCIDVSVPGAIPNWLGAPIVKLLQPTDQLVEAPRCGSKDQVERLYENTCSGKLRGNCTGQEDDTTDNLEKVWCFLENIRDPTSPQTGCYEDVKWSDRDGRFWSSLACFESPDIEGGVKRRVDDKRNKIFPLSADNIKQTLMNIKHQLSTTTTSTTEKIPIPVFKPQADDEFSSILNTIFKSANNE